MKQVDRLRKYLIPIEWELICDSCGKSGTWRGEARAAADKAHVAGWSVRKRRRIGRIEDVLCMNCGPEPPE